ncbi:MAG: hypothetical protein EOP54_01825 [Sphingobacteriales bacterium]|nr:MAG: hypothetical protein EOP54_01825 [Sphingobacteriales bacterium]
MSTFNICQGRIVLKNTMETDLNPSQLLIECFAHTSDHSSIWVGAGITDANGAFKIAIKEAYDTAPLKLKVYNHAQLIHEAFIDGIKNDIIMEIQTGRFDFLVDNDHLEKFHADYISVSGNINLGAENIPAVPGNDDIAVVLSQASFGVNEAIAGSYIDSMGNYEIRLPYRLLFSKQMAEKFSNSPLLIIEVVHAETTLLTQSELFEIQRQDTVVNLNIGIAYKQYFLDEFTLITNRITSATALDSLESIPNDINSIRRITNTSGLKEAMVSNMLQADLLAREIDIPLAHAYTFKRAGWDNYTDSEKAKDLIADAVTDHVIDEIHSNYDNTLDALRNKSIKDEGNKFISEKETLKDIILAITNDELITEIFIRESLKENDDAPEDFWTNIETLVGITYKDLLQKGLQVVALVGIQKEMVIAVMNALETEDQELNTYVTGKVAASWRDLIQALSVQHDKLCVPDEFRDPEAADIDPEIIWSYATYIYENSNKLFYTSFIKDEVLDSLTDQPEPVLKNIPALKTFLAQYPKYDFRIDNIWEQSEKISSMELHKDLQTLQNVSRIASGNVALMKGLLSSGIKSSFQIADMSEADFIEMMAPKVSLEVSLKLKHAYDLASQIDSYIKSAYTQLNPSNFVMSNLTKEAVSKTVWQSQGNPNSTFAYPDLETLFGSQDFCACTECSSMYSPSAYFTDVMNFIRTKVGTDMALKTLDKRRPDLKYIDLSCKNANTVLPYIDLVNETLELQILNYYNSLTLPGNTPDPDIHGLELPGSFQTGGTEAELDANPEHVYKDDDGKYVPYEDYTLVYDKKLSKAIYPNSLPFNMAKVESDAFLAHSGLSKVALMNSFRPATFNGSNSNQGVNTYTRGAAYLGLDTTAADIISGSTAYGDPEFYGTDQTGLNNLTADLESLLKRTSLEYTEFLQIMVTDYLNPLVPGTNNRRFTITNKPGFPADTCALNELSLQCSPANGEQAYNLVKVFFKHLHRFVRLYRATKWSIYQLDIVLRSIGLNHLYVKDTNTNTYVDPMTKTVFTTIAGIKEVSDIFGKAPEHICTLWSNLDTYAYIDFKKEQVLAPSVYDSFFRNKSLLNPLDPNFENPEQISGTIQENAGTISAVLQIEVKQIAEILNNDLSQNTDLATLSHIMRCQTYAAFFGDHSFATAIERLRMINHSLPSVSPLNVPEILDIVKEFEWADQEVFTWEERAYLLTGKDPAANFTPANSTIEQFLKDLRKMLQTIAKDQDIEAATNVELKKRLKQETDHLFTDTFNLPKTQFTKFSDPVKSFIQPFLEISAGGSLLDVLSKNEFVKGTADLKPTDVLADGITAEAVYNLYRMLSKITMMSSKLRLDDALISFFHKKGTGFLPADQFSAYDLTNLPSLFATGFTAYLKWIKVRDFFNLNTEVLQKMIEEKNLVNWAKLIVDYTGLDASSLEMILGSVAFPSSGQSINGILEGYFNDTAGATPHNGNMDLLLQAYDIISYSSKLGMQVSDLYAAIRPEASLLQARMIRKALKSQYNPEQWLKTIKPIQNKLRTAQRDVLVDYILANPQIVGSTAAVLKTANNLFEHLLIDVEMESCMKTSRLKMAISSAQLFMDRAILKLEKTYNGSATISLSQEAITQWHEWRKWYRIWEANRKVFLYPENWIEPELRDKKTKFFRELEAHLLQDEITDARVEDGFRIYLEGLNEVARLEPVSAYQQTTYGRNILHVFARTDSNPQRYYYRNREDNEWSDWQKIDVDIKSDQVSPVMWNNKLYVFWLTFQKTKGADGENKADDNTIGNGKPSMRNNATAPNSNKWTDILTTANGGNLVGNIGEEQYTVWKVTLNWTQFQNGKWQSQEMCKDIMELDINKFQINQTNKNSYTSADAKAAIDLLTGKNTVKIDEFFKNRIYLYTPFEGAPPNEAHGVCFNLVIPGGLVEVGFGAHSFLWKGDNSRDPYVLMDSDRGCRVIAPEGTRINKMKFIQDPKLISSGLKANNGISTFGDGYYAFAYDYLLANLMHKATSPFIVLGKTPNAYRLTASAPSDKNDAYCNPLKNTFFFEDQNHTFLVEEAGSNENVYKAVNLDQLMIKDAARVASQQGFTKSLATIITANGQRQAGDHFPAMNRFRFNTFYHAQVPNLIASLNQSGVPGLLTLANQSQADTIKFATTYSPTTRVDTKYPVSNMQFAFSDPYSMYNWEVFFHAPMMIAQGLTQNQQFAAAQQWFHYIFDPTSSSGNGKQRFWKFKPFFDEAGGTIQTLPQLLQAINNNGAAVEQVKAWEKDPFNPHRIARMRVLAYMKNVVMKYLDNLIAWADSLFRQDTMESINEATQLYILAANILGDRPMQIPQRTKRADLAFYNFMPQLFKFGNGTITQEPNTAYITSLDALSNAMVAIESFYAPNAAAGTSVYSGTNLGTMSGGPRKGEGNVPLQTFYFCLPNNDKLIKYWDLIADRLFKIRNCKNVDGLTRQLSLYESPIDPALLVRARAMGISTESFLNQLYGSKRPLHRFSYMVQKTNEILGDVKALGGAMLSALEKKDAETIALLRSTQEHEMLTKIRSVKEQQVEEAAKNLEGLRISQVNTKQRFDYYASRKFTNANEQKHLDKMQSAMEAQVIQGVLNTVAGVVSAIPQISTFPPGAEFGGLQLANVFNAAATAVSIKATVDNAKGSMAATKGGYERRMDDWQFQKASAAKELEQLEQQLFAAQIRLDITRQELRNHELQTEQNREMDTYMRGKFSNTELYNWMVGQLATTYFQSYQMAFDMARQAEQCYEYELGKTTTGIIKQGYWDSLKRGLLSGENLQLDVRRLEKAYMESNDRELELTKNISLALFQPQAIVDIKATGKATITIPEVLFDMDYPGHYMRRIKSVSLSIPCITGPYTTINCQLHQKTNRYRKVSTARTLASYKHNDNFTEFKGGNFIATSAAQNDSGVFELNFRDERYLPFEGTGVISEWEISFPGEIRQFDLNSINDIIFHIKYTAKYDHEMAEVVNDSVKDLFMTLTTTGNFNTHMLQYYTSAKHEHSADWFDYGKKFTDNESTRLALSFNQEQFPFFTNGKKVTVKKIKPAVLLKSALNGNYTMSITYTANGTYVTKSLPVTIDAAAGKLVTTDIGFDLGTQSIVFQQNTKVIQVSLKDADNELVNATELFEDMIFVMDYIVEEDLATPAANDKPEYDLNRNQLVAWWAADEAQNTFTEALATLHDKSGNGRHLQDLDGWNGAEVPELKTSEGIQHVHFSDMSGMVQRTHFSNPDYALKAHSSFTVISVANGIFGLGINGAFNNDNNGANLNMECGLVNVILKDGQWHIANIPIQAAKENMLLLDTFEQKPETNTSYLSAFDRNGNKLVTHTFNSTEIKNAISAGLRIGFWGSLPSGANQFYEALVFDRILPEAEIKSVLSYLKSKYPFLN